MEIEKNLNQGFKSKHWAHVSLPYIDAIEIVKFNPPNQNKIMLHDTFLFHSIKYLW